MHTITSRHLLRERIKAQRLISFSIHPLNAMPAKWSDFELTRELMRFGERRDQMELLLAGARRARSTSDRAFQSEGSFRSSRHLHAALYLRQEDSQDLQPPLGAGGGIDEEQDQINEKERGRERRRCELRRPASMPHRCGSIPPHGSYSPEGFHRMNMAIGLIALCCSAFAILATPWPTADELLSPYPNGYSKSVQQGSPTCPDLPKSSLRGIG